MDDYSKIKETVKDCDKEQLQKLKDALDKKYARFIKMDREEENKKK